jgi:hypothetical protein
MSAGRVNDGALRATHAYSEPSDPAAAADWGHRAGAAWIDQYVLGPADRQPARPRFEGIKIDRLDRVRLVSADSFKERAIRFATVAVLLAVTVLGLVCIGGSEWIRVSTPAPAPSASLPPVPATSVQAPTPSAAETVPSSAKGDRLPVSIEELAARADSPKVLQKAPEIIRVPPTAPSKAARPSATAQAEDAGAKRILTPVPETRPATIPGWTVREVAGDSVVLDGPHGARRVARGESVPGLGRVEAIVRWGNRWIVTTERGLISTN